MISKAEIITKLQELKPTLQTDYSVKEIGLFGSFSDDTFNEESDIDILLNFTNLLVGSFFRLKFF